MMASRSLPSAWLAGLAGVVLLTGHAQAQWFQDNTTDIPGGNPFNNSRSENVDFGDVDLDGDWDAVFADGGDVDQDQNRIWINQGPGGGLGTFVDETNTRFPAINDQSRDIEFVDFDNDGDLDIYTANTAAITPQSNKWWTNTGVGSGTYVDETAARWVGLGGPGSSIAPSQVLASGGFIDFSCDCDFGDLDNDGDLDLVHSSYGGVFGGNVPTRIFLNDGLGFFEEFNPSGAQLPSQTISNGFPGIWCEGTQQANTTNSTGTFCDIASSALDIDIGDIDGDYDLDILHGARQELPRMFQNRLEENGGVLGFRDVTGSTFPSGYSTGDGHYEQEMGDLDGDGDLDIYGLNWQTSGFTFNDVTFSNDGSGVYAQDQTLLSSGDDDNEGDFFDYDNDGDLDLYVANFSGQDRLYRNDNNGGTTFTFTNVTGSGLPNANATALDADACDVDEDGDYDVFVSNDNNVRNYYFENTLQNTDTHAPYLPHIEKAPDRAPGPDPTVVRVHVYDNAPYYITWYNPTVLEYTVDGGSPVQVPMMSSQGQIFRGEIPGSLTGRICYKAISSDRYGNTGESGTQCYDAGGSTGTGTATCFGDGSGAACGCNNESAPGSGAGCLNGLGVGGVLSASGDPDTANDTVGLSCSGVRSQPGLFFQGNNAIGGGTGATFGDGIRCCGQNVVRLQIVVPPDPQPSTADLTVTITDQGPAGTVNPGDTKCYQYWYRDPSISPCGNNFNLSNAVTITWN